MARPSKYSETLADKLCIRLAEGESLRSICTDDEFPDKSTVIRWLATKPEFCDRYAQAKQVSTYLMAEDILDIADDSQNDFIEKLAKDGGRESGLSPENIQRSRLRVDSRKWLMAKLMPNRYGEKQQLEHSGPDGKPIQHDHTLDSGKVAKALEDIAKKL